MSRRIARGGRCDQPAQTRQHAARRTAKNHRRPDDTSPRTTAHRTRHRRLSWQRRHWHMQLDADRIGSIHARRAVTGTTPASAMTAANAHQA